MTTAPVPIHMIPAGVTYLTFSKDHDQEKARLRFVKKFGVEPEEVVRDHNLLWLGPIPETRKDC